MLIAYYKEYRDVFNIKTRGQISNFAYPVLFQALESLKTDLVYTGPRPKRLTKNFLSLLNWIFVDFLPKYKSCSLLSVTDIKTAYLFKTKEGSFKIFKNAQKNVCLI